MEALLEPSDQVLLVLGDLDRGDAEGGKAERAGALAELLFDAPKVCRRKAASWHYHAGQYNEPHGVAGRDVFHSPGAGARCTRHRAAGHPRLHADEAGRARPRCVICARAGPWRIASSSSAAAATTAATATCSRASPRPPDLRSPCSRPARRRSCRGDARQAYADLRGSGVAVHPFAAESLSEGEVIVDALLGTGLKGHVRGRPSRR